MARDFNVSANEYLIGTISLSAYPFTIFTRFYPVSALNAELVLSFHSSAAVATSRARMIVRDTSVLRYGLANAGSGPDIDTGNSYAANAWNEGVMMSASATAHTVVLNGDWANRGTSATSVTLPTFNEIRIGNSNSFADFNGYVAETAQWDVALTQAEVESLSTDISPLFVRPESLVYYWPLIRTEDRDIIGGVALTPTASPGIAPHPPVRYPRRTRIIVPPAAAATVNTLLDGLSAMYTFDETEGNSRLDSSGNGRTLTESATSGGVGSVTALISNGAELDPANAEQLRGASAAACPSPVLGLTMHGFVKVGTFANDDDMIGSYGLNVAAASYRIVLLASGSLRFQISNGSTTKEVDWDGSTLSADTRYFVDCGYDPDNDLIWINVDRGTRDETDTTGFTPQAPQVAFAVSGRGDAAGRLADLNEMDNWGIYGGYVVSESDLDAAYNGGAGLAFAEWDATPTSGVTLSPLAVTATVVAPTVTAGQSVEPSPLAVTAAVVAPTVSVGTVVTLAPIAVTATVVAPTAEISQQVAPSPTQVTATVVAPTVLVGQAVASAQVVVTATVVAPTITTAVVVTLSPIAVTATAVAPTATIRNTVEPDALPVTVTVVAPTVLVGQRIEIAPAQVTATVVAPMVTTGISISLTPLTVTATLVAPTAQSTQTVTIAPLTATATVVAPSLTVGARIQLSPTAVTATLVAPTVSNPLNIDLLGYRAVEHPGVRAVEHPGIRVIERAP